MCVRGKKRGGGRGEYHSRFNWTAFFVACLLAGKALRNTLRPTQSLDTGELISLWFQGSVKGIFTDFLTEKNFPSVHSFLFLIYSIFLNWQLHRCPRPPMCSSCYSSKAFIAWWQWVQLQVGRGKVLGSKDIHSWETSWMLCFVEAGGGRGTPICNGNFLSLSILAGFRELCPLAGLSLPWIPRTSLRFYSRSSPPPCCPVFKKCPLSP